MGSRLHKEGSQAGKINLESIECLEDEGLSDVKKGVYLSSNAVMMD